MFVHSGAGLHGHEYSSRQPSPQRTQPALRSSMRRQLEDPRRFSSPLTATANSHAQEPTHRSLRPISLPPNRRSISDHLRTRDQSVRFHEEPVVSEASTPAQSEDEESVVGSDYTESSSKRRRRQRTPRKSTQFVLAQPPPRLLTKQRMLVQFRPKLLLQLQELGQRRPIPAFDVVPSSHIAGTIIIPALRKRFPRVFRTNPELGSDDLIIVRSEDFTPNDYTYNTTTTTTPSGADSNNIEDREVLAVVSIKSRGDIDQAEITMGNGSTWAISPIANGSYEIVKLNDHGHPLTARWVKKPTISRRNSTASTADTVSSSASIETKWTFSVMDPSARRHPIMGLLTPNMLEVYDSYTTMSMSSNRYPPSRSFGPERMAEENKTTTPIATTENRMSLAVSEDNKALMMASAVWINLRAQGWPSAMNPKCSRMLNQYRHSISEAYPRSQPYDCAHRNSSGESHLSKSDTFSYIKDNDVVSPTHQKALLPVRSASTGANFLRAKPKEESATSDSLGEGNDYDPELQQDSLPGNPHDDRPKQRAGSKMITWIRKRLNGTVFGRHRV